jgi:hypothetical protein
MMEFKIEHAGAKEVGKGTEFIIKTPMRRDSGR